MLCCCRLPCLPAVHSRLTPERASGVIVVGTREFQPQPVPGQRLLTADPIKTMTDAQRDTKSGKRSEKCRVPLIHESEQRDWLMRKPIGAAEIELADVLPHAPVFFRKGNRGGNVVTVTFEGMLRVSEPEALVAHLENGTGPANTFGCGLMLVRRL